MGEARSDRAVPRAPGRGLRHRGAAELDPIDARDGGGRAGGAGLRPQRSPEPDPATVDQHVYAEPLNPAAAMAPAAVSPTTTTSWLDAVRDGIAEEMRRDPYILYFGEGTGERGGTFAHTKNLYEEFGAPRMVDTPISEQGFTSAALGASATGARTIADLMFADFLFEAAGQIVLQAAKLRYMSNGQMNAPLVLRVGMGAVRSAGPHHSGAYYPMWAHVPGPDRLRAVQSGRRQGADEDGAEGLRSGADARIEGAVRDQGRGAGRRASGALRRRPHRPPRNRPDYRHGRPARPSQRWKRPRRLPPRASTSRLSTCAPSCRSTWRRWRASVAKTHRLLIVDEAWAMCGVGAELGQAMNEIAYDDLDAPVARLHSAPITHPLAPALEREMLVDSDKIVAARTRPDGRHGAGSASLALPQPVDGRGAGRRGGAPPGPRHAPAACRQIPRIRRLHRLRPRRPPTASRSPCPSAI